MKYFRSTYILLIFLQIVSFNSSAQLFPGMKVNGRIVSQGDTINVCKGSALLYENTASGFNNMNWKFDLGSPATFVGINPPAIVYNTVGIDSTVQYISTSTNKDSLYIIIRVSNEKPAVGYNFTPDNVCGNIPISFTNNSSGNKNAYLWDFGDGTTSSAFSPSHQFLNAVAPPAGTLTYNVKLIVNNIFGCKDSVSKPVTIKKVPDATIGNADIGVTYVQATSTFKVCTIIPSYTFKFTNQSATISNNVSYKIIWGDHSPDSVFTSWPASSIIIHEYTIGSNNLTLEVTGPDGCIGIRNYVVFLGTNPAGGFSSLGNTNVCAPDSLRFVITGYQNNSPGTRYTVTINDGSAPQIFTHPPPDTVTHYFNYTSCGTTSSNGTVQFNNSFSATLNIENPCDLTSVSVIPIYVSGKPKASIYVEPSNTVCTNSYVLIRSTSTYGGVVTSFGGGSSSCSNTGKQVWSISPSSGFTISPGYSTGTLNGSPGNGFLWTSGSVFLFANFTIPGTYTIKLYVFNDRCGIDSTIQTICVRNPPQASFKMSNKSACLTGNTVITNTSPVGLCQGDTYKWTVTYFDPLGCGTTGTNYSFINGSTATSTNPELQFSVPGKYAITLTTTAIGTNFSCPTATFTDTFIVKGKPKLTINPIAGICANYSITPSAIVSGCYADSALKYNWSFTNGTPSSSTSAVPGTIGYSLLGSHPVQLNVTSECGITTVNTSINVVAPPVANAGPDKNLCSRSSITIGASGVAGVTYNWLPASGLNDPNIVTPVLSLAYTGNNPDTVYNYEVTAAAGANCSSKDTVLITVKKRPVVIASPKTSNICEGLNIQLTASGAISYTWSPSAGLNKNNTDTVIATPPATTVYEVAGIGANGCADTAKVTVTIQPYPVVNAGNDSTVCNNTTTVQFSGSPVDGTWSGTNITSAGLFNPQLSGNGTYALKYTATLNQCGKADSIVVTVIDPPVANAGLDKTICQDSISITLAGSPAGGNWTGTPLVTANGNFTPSAAGVYTLIYTFGSGSCIAKDSMMINVIGNITNNMITSNQSVCINTQPAVLTGQAATGGNGTPTYQWQMSTDSINWLNITGETGLNYAPPILTQTTFYRRYATTVLCSGLQGNYSLPVKITIRQDAKARYAANPTISCSPFNLANAITVSSFPDNNGLYQWFADNILFGSNTTGTFPGYIMQNPDDTVIIKLKTTSQYGCKPDSIEQQFITVITAQAKFNKDTSYGCGPLPVAFTNTSSLLNGIRFFWNFGNGITSNLTQPGTIIFNSSPFFNDTTFHISLKAYNGCDTTVWRDSVKVRSNPRARFGVDTTFGCSPFTVQVSNTSPGGLNKYYWDFGNGVRDTTFANGTFNFTYNIGNAVDTFTIRLIAENQCARDTQSINLRVAPNIIRPLINVNSSQLFGCAPHIVSFSNNTSGTTGFTWDFGDNTPALITNNNQSNIVHTFNNAGVFTVAVDITNGCSDTTVFRQVTVYAKPLAAFTTNASVYCEGDTIKVNNTSANATNYRWFWGDGSMGAGLNPVHVYAVAGNYNIVLRAERSNSSGTVCVDTLTLPVTVLAKPVVTIQSNINTINCAPFTLNVAAPGIISESATWYFYDSTVTPSIISSKNISAQYTFNKPGSFYVKLVAVNSRRCADSTIIYFTVRGKAVASFTPFNLAVCTRDTTVNYINTSTYNGTDPISYRWLVNNSLVSTGANFTHRYNVLPAAILPKVFNTSLIVSNTVGCSDTANANLQMNPVAKAQFSISNPNDCVPFKPVIINASSYTTNYRWLLNGRVVDTTANPFIVITEGSSLYKISLIADNIYACKPDTFNISFTSRARPNAAFRVNDTLGCTGVLNVATSNLTTGAASYIWNWGDGTPNSVFKNSTHLYNIQGQYLITLVASDGVCTDTTEQSVKVSINPVVKFSVDQTVTCDTARVRFTNLSENGNNYLWSFGDGTYSTDTNPSKSFAPNAIPYTVKLIAFSTYGCKDSAVKANLVLAKVSPAVDFYISPSPIITVPHYTFNFNNLTLSSANYKYLWSLGDGSFSTARDVTHKYADTGNYTIRLIVLDTATNCPDTTTKIARIDGFPGYLYVPNAICPACIQSNLREFLPKGAGLKEYRLQIYTTWNELIFETRTLDSKGTPTQAWDGKFKGAIVQQDVYVWRIDAKFLNGSEWLGMRYPGEGKLKKAGTITVIK